MDDNLKLILVAIVIMFFISRLMDNAQAYPTYSSSKSTTSKTQNLPATSKIITTQILDSQGQVVRTGETRY